MLEASPDDIVVEGGRASVKGSPSPSVTMAEIADLAYFGKDKLPADVPMGLEASARYRAEAFNIWANATHVCTCEVDIETGQVELLRYVVAEDCGPMINPNVVEGQIAGGTVQGIGGVLLEDFPWDEEGNPLATTFVDYLLPTSTEVPIIEYVHTEGSPGPGPGRVQGRRRGRRDRRARGRRERDRRRARAARRHDHPPPAQPVDDRGADRRGTGDDDGSSAER